MNEATDIRKLSAAELSAFLKQHNQPGFRARQIYDWLWKKNVSGFEAMTNLSHDLRKLLASHFVIKGMKIVNQQVSSDGTIKCAFSLYDENRIEGVLIPSGKRMTACISSQVGCSLTCKFCATGKLKRIRNLEATEIYDQVVAINALSLQHYGHALSNIVYMGMGEPLLNYREVMQSIKLITNPDGMNMSPQRITVSTAGIAKMIERLADEQIRFNLALSLHAANDRKRSLIMPINEQNNLSALKSALVLFTAKTGSRITFEYIVFHSFNDSIEDAGELIRFSKGLPVKINLIEYNPVEGTGFRKASGEQLKRFRQYLETKGRLIVNVRRSRGKDIDAACGQLANKPVTV